MWPTFIGITRTSHISVYSCTESVHADSPPPRTLISYGARDWVQTSTSPNEISFWVQSFYSASLLIVIDGTLCLKHAIQDMLDTKKDTLDIA